MITAFQRNAFQNNAFQIDLTDFHDGSELRKKKFYLPIYEQPKEDDIELRILLLLS